MEYEIKNPVRVSDEMINVEWNHPDFGWIPFTAVNTSLPQWSREPEYMADIWNAIVRGDFGPIAQSEEN